MFTCYGKLGKFAPASKLASTFVLTFVADKSTPFNFWYFSTQLSLKVLAKQSRTAKICLHFTVECCLPLFVKLWSARVTRSNQCLSKLAGVFVLALVEKIALHCIPRNFLHRVSWRFWRIGANRPKIILMLTESLQHVFVWPSENRRSGARSDHQKKQTTKKRRVLLDPVLTAGVIIA